jgi:cytoskeleton protein RodZ
VSATPDSTLRPGPGSALRAARESHGYSIQDLADALNLTPRVVDDLESERWERLPGPAFVRGYVRAYAKLVGLDADEIFDRHRGLDGGGDGREGRIGEMRRKDGLADLAARQPGAVISGAVLAAVGVVAIVLYLVWPQAANEPAEAPGVALRLPASPTAYVPAPGGSRPVATPGPVFTPRVAAPAIGPSAAAAPESQAALASTADASASAPQATTGAETDAVSATAFAPVAMPASGVVTQTHARTQRLGPEGEDRVDFEFTEDCWVDVADARGRRFSDLARAGDALVLIGQAPFRIRLGYGPGASVAFNGRSVALTPHTRSNVASLVLDPAPAAGVAR